LAAVDTEGRIVLAARAHALAGDELATARRLVIAESLRWGEPTVLPGPGELLLWAAPLMHNSRLLGGLVAGISEQKLFVRGQARIDLRAACADLRRLAEEHNLTNAALLESRRREYRQEQVRAEAIHSFKATPHYDIRALYLLEEPALVNAIRKNDRGEARSILNRLLVGMIHRAGEQLELLKSFFMELVATLSRTAVEAGAPPEELLGANFASLTDLAAIHTEQKLAYWLHEMLERVMDAMHRNRAHAHTVLLANALRFMTERCCEQITRNDAAAAARMSPSHFSRLFSRHMGMSFVDVLNRMRTERAAELLARSDKPLKIIALESGFADQSYFTKVFRRWHGITPARYRRQRTS